MKFQNDYQENIPIGPNYSYCTKITINGINGMFVCLFVCLVFFQLILSGKHEYSVLSLIWTTSEQ